MRGYTVSGKTAAFTTARSLLVLTNATSTVLLLTSAEVSAPDNDTNEQIDCCIQRITNVATANGTLVTPSKHSKGDPDSVLLNNCWVDDTAAHVFDADEQTGRQGGSSVGSWRWQASNIHEWVEVSPSESMAIRILTNMNTSKALTVRLTYLELGG